MKYLAIDYGQKRTGIAVSDSGGSMAFPRRTIQMRTREAFFEELLALLEAEAPDALVIGLPVNLDGEETLTTRQTRNFAKNLKKKTPLPIFWMEEALSSFEAEIDLRQAGRSAAKSRAVLDQQAAVRILQSFLDQPEGSRKAL
ncbi:MAG TPA: Holliday junction resolvase RuvX [Candidatus Bilophila faecipullorum]|uniref:Putative pre-16S rRNA nuclease n=2 Tax=Bilophila TaxID=35832 RepID=A0A9D1UA32_9BACT|nr:Holliday junction resolvase RuvX [uncultured Bilophila sp.]HIW79126.1 Holliday junction resolvase RuvX [Candidatus Bilophila faecipullorum]